MFLNVFQLCSYETTYNPCPAFPAYNYNKDANQARSDTRNWKQCNYWDLARDVVFKIAAELFASGFVAQFIVQLNRRAKVLFSLTRGRKLNTRIGLHTYLPTKQTFNALQNEIWVCNLIWP